MAVRWAVQSRRHISDDHKGRPYRQPDKSRFVGLFQCGSYLTVGAGNHTGPQPNRQLYTPKQNGFFDSGFAYAQNDTVFDGFCVYRSSDVILSVLQSAANLAI